jgi:hypothetical protein
VRLAQRSLASRPAHLRRHLYVTRYTEGFSHFVTSMTAPVASGWSVRRVELSPTGKRRLLMAHANSRHSRVGGLTGSAGSNGRDVIPATLGCGSYVWSDELFTADAYPYSLVILSRKAEEYSTAQGQERKKGIRDLT